MFMCFVMGQVVAQRLMVRRGLDPAPAADMIFAAVVGGLLGAKLYYVVVLGNWHSLFDRSGFVYWGGFLGGALGNILDRVRLGFVQDYADLHFGAWSPFLTFNLADAAITIGVLVLLVRAILVRDKPATSVSVENGNA